MKRTNLPIQERIESHIISKTDCWITDLTKSKKYPLIHFNMKKEKVSYIMYRLYVGKIPEGMFVCHKCNNPKCVNPEHLFLEAKKSPLEKIESRIISKKGCWLTDLALSSNGYPHIWINGKTKLVSRVMYESYKGEIPDKMFVCHKCDNPKCVNPDHLFLGTHQDNMNDRNSKNRQSRQKGSQNAQSKLNEEQVLEIKRLLAETNLTQKEIGEKYGVDHRTISLIKRGKNWTHVNYQPTNITNNITNYNAPVTNHITNYNCSECPRQLSLFDVDEIK